jgi:hypothetical protein
MGDALQALLGEWPWLALGGGARIPQRHNHRLGTEAHEIEEHILKTMRADHVSSRYAEKNFLRKEVEQPQARGPRLLY